jgi:hypothetical protein
MPCVIGIALPQHLDGGRLARAVGAEQSEQLTLADLERHTAYGMYDEDRVR